MTQGTQVIVLNGGSSAGKTGLVRCLQAVLPEAWLTVGVDSFIDALPARLRLGNGGIEFASDGGIAVGEEFRRLERLWYAGVAAMAQAGARVIVDEVFLGGAASQERVRAALEGLNVLWVGVLCDPDTAEGRELARGDRVPGMARQQAKLVHQGVQYDFTVNTAQLEPLAAARLVATQVQQVPTL